MYFCSKENNGLMHLLPPALLEGFIIGFLVTAPVGPICILCIQRSLTYGPAIGIASGFGSAASLMLYGSMVAVGVTMIASWAPGYQLLLTLAGAIVLCIMGWKIMVSVPPTGSADIQKMSAWKACVTCFVLEMINPASIAIFVGLFAVLGYKPPTNLHEFIMIGIGVFFSSILWWIALCLGVGLIRGYMKYGLMLWLNRLSGVVIILLGLQPLLPLFLS